MDDTEDAAADFSPVLSPGRKRNYTPNVDGFSKKDTAQVTAQTSTLILELPTRIPAPIPPPNSPSLMMNRHQFQNSTISATDENKYKKSRVFLFCNFNSFFQNSSASAQLLHYAVPPKEDASRTSAVRMISIWINVLDLNFKNHNICKN